MEYYFLYNKSYEREFMKNIFLDMGFNEEIRKIMGTDVFRYFRGDIFVNLTSQKEGRIQIQTPFNKPRDEIIELKDKLKPDRIVDMNLEDII